MLTPAENARAKANAARRGVKRGAYDNLRAAGKPMAVTKREPGDFKTGAPYETFSAQNERRRIGASQAGFSAGSRAAALGAAGVAGAKIAASDTAQYHGRIALPAMQAAKHPLAPALKRAMQVGHTVRGARTRTAVGGLALAGTATGLHQVANWRKDEASGISEGIGRIKAGRRVVADRSKIIKNAGALANDLKRNYSTLKTATELVNQHGKAVAITGGSIGAIGAVARGTYGVKARNKAKRELRVDVGKRGLYEENDSLQLARVSGAGLGGAALAYGIPRLRSTSGAVAWGQRSESLNARTLANAAQRVSNTSERVTRTFEKPAGNLASHSGIGRMATGMPRGLKAGAAVIIGAELVRHNTPVRRRSYERVTGYPGSYR